MREPTGIRLARMREYRRNMARAYPGAPTQIAERERSMYIRRAVLFVVGRAFWVWVLAAAFGLATGLRCAGR